MNNNIISLLLAPKKGLLAADESGKTITKRFEKIGLKSNPETNLAYRKMLFSTPGIEQYISGVILYDETIRQSIDGLSIPNFLENKGIIPGIKVDLGAIELPGYPGEKVTEGLEGLEQRLTAYKHMGARFTKWRAVIKIGENIPTENCLEENGQILSKYAKVVQELGLVPIIEPEVIRDGGHDLQKCKQITIQTLKKVFEKVKEEGIDLENLLLKPNMVTAGQDDPTQATPEEVGKVTIEVLTETVPPQVPGIVFLSGGQSADMATENLNAICKIGGPWVLTYSYSRALQNEPMEIWAGKDENVKEAQKAFLERAKKVSLASQGKLS